MLIVYGSLLCPDCVRCKEELTAAGISFEYRDFSENLRWLKDFLSLRESSPIFDEVRKNGKIGIPCLVREDGTVSLSWEEYM